jgi:hypothetical protein
MAYKVGLYHKEEHYFFYHRYLYYTKRQVLQMVRDEYPDCEVISIERMLVM